MIFRARSLLKMFFDKHSMQLDHAIHPAIGLDKVAHHENSLVILDIGLPDMDGFEVCRQIRKISDVPIIMLTARGDVMDRVIGLELGADDYLAKPFEPRELLVRIQNILKRVQPGANAASSKAASSHSFENLTINYDKRAVTVNGSTITLSTMEYQLLALFTQSAGKTFTRDEILNHLRGIDCDIFNRSVDILVSRLRQKLRPATPLMTVRGSGYLFIGTYE
ncbi:MAG: two-component system OmpR family response regulator [Flavobacteriales bacterium]|jgi:two-component system OmpR family response regulator